MNEVIETNKTLATQPTSSGPFKKFEAKEEKIQTATEAQDQSKKAL